MTAEYEIARRVRSRIVEEMTELRQAEHDVKIYAPEVAGMVFDSASAAYASALESRGVPRGETVGLPASTLRVLLKKLSRGAPTMAFDSKGGSSVLDSIFNGIEPPRDVSIRSDFRR
jgi:hypothetical protein